jgi:F-type H+-transporting ATPase subunit c
VTDEPRRLDRCDGGSRPDNPEREAEMFSLPLFAETTGITGITGNLHVALAAFAAALAVGLIGMKAVDAVGRNPGAATKVLVQSILSIAFAEAIVFYVLFLVS